MNNFLPGDRSKFFLSGLLFAIINLSSFWLTAQVLQKPSVRVDGEVRTCLILYADDLLKMKRTDLMFKDFSGLEYRYSGVALTDILKQAGVSTTKLQGEDLAKYLLAKSADGSEIVISFAELDPNLTDQTIILADQMNGKPLAPGTGPFRIVAPKDKERTRWIWEVNGLTVRYARE